MRRSLSILAALTALLVPLSGLAPDAQAAGSAAAVPAPLARVIVRLKADSALLRRQTLASDPRAVPGERARGLAERLGRTMSAGRAIDERTQVVFAEGVTSSQLAEQLRQQRDVELAVVDHRRHRLEVPSDPLYANGGANGPASGQWYLKPPSPPTVVSSIDAQSAWDVTTGSTSVVVAMLDTGVRFDHPDLRPVANGGNLLPGADMIVDHGDGLATANDGNARDTDASDPGDWVSQADKNTNPNVFGDCAVEPSSWHGTQTAALVGATTSNGVGMAGVGRSVRVLPVRVLGKCGGFDSDIVAGMRWAAGLAVPGVPDNPAANQAKVINLSLGGSGSCDLSAYPAAIADVTARGVVVVASAGNSVGHQASVPATCAGVIAVAGLRHVGTKVGFSDLGPEIAISAPGGNCVNTVGACLFPILTASNAGATAPAGNIFTDGSNATAGTSFSAPLVAGTAALMLSLNPNLSPADVKLLLQQTARTFPTTGGDNTNGTPVLECTAPQFDADATPVAQEQCYCSTGTCGAGMLDAAAAVRAVQAGTAVRTGRARIDLNPKQAVAGSTLQLSGTASSVATNRTIAGYAWALLDGGGIVTSISGNASSTAAVVPSAAGRFKVRLTVTDSDGQASSSDLTIVANAAGSTPVPAPEPAPVATGGGGGGGALGLPWLLLLAAAIPALASTRRRKP